MDYKNLIFQLYFNPVMISNKLFDMHENVNWSKLTVEGKIYSTSS